MLRRGSLPVRGAWIEMVIVRFSRDSVSSLPVRGAWIEIQIGRGKWLAYARRSPCGERGLKSPPVVCRWIKTPSLPVRGAWIEMLYHIKRVVEIRRSPCGERGLKSPSFPARTSSASRRSPCGERGLKFSPVAADAGHAPRAGSVD